MISTLFKLTLSNYKKGLSKSTCLLQTELAQNTHDLVSHGEPSSFLPCCAKLTQRNALLDRAG